MDQTRLKELLDQSARLMGAWSGADQTAFCLRFGEALASLEGWQSFRINPRAFAERFSLDTDDTLAAFIHGAKAGLFSFEWLLLCPYCGGREYASQSLDQLEQDSYHCTTCQVDLPVATDENMEVPFTLVPEVSGGHPDPYKNMDSYLAYFRSSNFIPSPAVVALGKAAYNWQFMRAVPGQTVGCRVRLKGAKTFRLLSLDSHTMVHLRPLPPHSAGTATADIPQVRHSVKGFEKNNLEVPVAADGSISVLALNTAATEAGIIAVSQDLPRIFGAMKTAPASFRPFVSGKDLLNNQAFRDLFLIEHLPADLHLRVNELTLMFTDLKGSTDLYERTGDSTAFRLVNDHFAILRQETIRQRGAIVKTIGDAIMASFPSPEAGVRAASAMITRLDAYNAGLADPGQRIQLKVGLHLGPVLAVKANQTLDYFGQAVNLAARVQGLAEADEMVLSQELAGRQGIAELLAHAGWLTRAENAKLKGIAATVAVLRCHRGA